MNKNIKKRIILSLYLICILLITPCSYDRSIKTINKPHTNSKLSFFVISDVHIGANYFSQGKLIDALKDCKNINPDYDAMAIVGDLTHHGYECEYKSCMNILNKNKVKTASNVIAIGNHEYYNKGTNIEIKNIFLNETRMPFLYYDKWIKGYHFIVLAPENKGENEISSWQLSWLKDIIKLNESKDKPIFVFLHQPIRNTVYGSYDYNSIKNDEKVFDILKEYPQVIFFSGHSHYNLDNKDTMYKNKFTMFNTGAINYLMRKGEQYEPENLSQGLMVEVFNHKVTVKCREFSSNKWLPEYYEVDF